MPQSRDPLFGQYLLLLFFHGVLPKEGPPGAPSTLVRIAHTLFVRSEVGLGGLGRHVVNGKVRD